MCHRRGRGSVARDTDSLFVHARQAGVVFTLRLDSIRPVRLAVTARGDNAQAAAEGLTKRCSESLPGSKLHFYDHDSTPHFKLALGSDPLILFSLSGQASGGMMNNYFAELGDVWKHLPLADILRITPPRHYWET